jgi:hypothetical protein
VSGIVAGAVSLRQMTAALNARSASSPRAVKRETRGFELERADERPQSRRTRIAGPSKTARK